MSSYTLNLGLDVRTSYKEARRRVKRVLRHAIAQPVPIVASLSSAAALDACIRLGARQDGLGRTPAPSQAPLRDTLEALSIVYNQLAGTGASLANTLPQTSSPAHVAESVSASSVFAESAIPAVNCLSGPQRRRRHGVALETALTCAIAAAADATALHATGSAVTAGRVLRVALFSAVFSQPLRRWWREKLDEHIGCEDDLQLPDGLRSLRMVVDRGVYIPAILCLFFTWMRVSECAPQAVLPCIREKLLPCLLANWSMQGLADVLHQGWLHNASVLQHLHVQSAALYSDVLRPLFVRCGGEYVVVHVWAALPQAECASALKLGSTVLLSDLRAVLLDTWCGVGSSLNLLVA